LGHARGAGDPGAPSTVLKFRIHGGQAAVDIYRAYAAPLFRIIQGCQTAR
jgi:hypothetical protein